MHKQGGGVMYMELDLTFFAAALKASLWVMSGLPALMRWISSLHTNRHLNVPHHFISSFHHPRYACVIGIDPTVGICATCKMERSYQLLEHFTMHGPSIVVRNIQDIETYSGIGSVVLNWCYSRDSLSPHYESISVHFRT